MSVAGEIVRPLWCRACDRAYEGDPEAPCPRCAATGEDPTRARLLEDEHRLLQGITANIDELTAQEKLIEELAAKLDRKRAEAALARATADASERHEPTRIDPTGPAEIADAEYPCPACRERIKVLAKVCRFCRTDLDEFREKARRKNRGLDEKHEREEPKPEPRRGRGLGRENAAGRHVRRLIEGSDDGMRAQVTFMWWYLILIPLVILPLLWLACGLGGRIFGR